MQCEQNGSILSFFYEDHHAGAVDNTQGYARRQRGGIDGHGVLTGLWDRNVDHAVLVGNTIAHAVDSDDRSLDEDIFAGFVFEAKCGDDPLAAFIVLSEHWGCQANDGNDHQPYPHYELGWRGSPFWIRAAE